MNMIYSDYSGKGGVWHPLLEQGAARSLTLEGAIKVARALKVALPMWEFRVSTPDSDGWKWGTDLSVKAAVLSNMGAPPKVGKFDLRSRGNNPHGRRGKPPAVVVDEPLPLPPEE